MTSGTLFKAISASCLAVVIAIAASAQTKKAPTKMALEAEFKVAPLPG